jgi:hypothetical protein
VYLRDAISSGSAAASRCSVGRWRKVTLATMSLSIVVPSLDLGDGDVEVAGDTSAAHSTMTDGGREAEE